VVRVQQLVVYFETLSLYCLLTYCDIGAVLKGSYGTPCVFRLHLPWCVRQVMKGQGRLKICSKLLHVLWKSYRLLFVILRQPWIWGGGARYSAVLCRI
jgi:hypothetical protein